MTDRLSSESSRSTDELCFLAAHELRKAYRARELSPVEVVDAVLDRIARVDSRLNSFVTLLPDDARAAARRAEKEMMSSGPEELGLLHGIPVTVKDLTETAGVRTTFGSVLHKDNVPDRDAIGWARMKRAGSILLGKTTTPDFGMLGVTQSTLTGVTSNPWNTTRTAGGSSGGAAASVVAGLGHLAWGSDGGGSIRIPAACCGAVGLKASPGRIPLYLEEGNLFETVSTVGPITRNVTDCALLLAATAGPDRRDPVSLPASPVDYVAATLEASIEGLRIGYSVDLGQALISKEVAAAFERALDVLRDLGAKVEPVALELPDAIEYFLHYWGPGIALGVDAMMAAGAGPDQFPPATLELAGLGREVTLTEAIHCQTQVRTELAVALTGALTDHDLLACPTMPLTAFPHPGDVGGNTEIDGVSVGRPSLDFHRLTEPFSHAGLPALTVPAGFDAEGLPVGLQLVGSFHEDDLVLRAGAAYEAATPWSDRRPQLDHEGDRR